jgi:putative protease
MDTPKSKHTPPIILAPAGSKASFLAAVSAGADAIYCGLKQFSARMEAKNFRLEELAALTSLAHEKGTQVYVALNTLLKPPEIETAWKTLQALMKSVKPDALILQDLAVVQLARQAGFRGLMILSTLANVSFTEALGLLKSQLGIDRVVLPRELDIDEIKSMAKSCPEELGLEVFVHGALCYGVSGRCYWSSYFGGKSGLRGRCVQPCRRLYTQQDRPQRSFSCLDLSLDVLVKVLAAIPQVMGWKIEGRKKGPHYVFYTVKAYQLLRDHGQDPQAKKSARALLSMALGRKGTHYYFLPQRPQNPVSGRGRTGSGLYMGRVQGGRQKPYLSPLMELLESDVVRLGYEDEPGHEVARISKAVPRKGRLYLTFLSKKGLKKGMPVFLIDRREKELEAMLNRLETELASHRQKPRTLKTLAPKMPHKYRRRPKMIELSLYRHYIRKSVRDGNAYWLTSENVKHINAKTAGRAWWSLPPVVWPKEEERLIKMVNDVLEKGGRHFILNAPWQAVFFKDHKKMNLWAGPFCNLSNSLAAATLAEMGFSGMIVSPELGREDFLALPRNSPLPLGVILSANWPLCVSRIEPEAVKPEAAFSSPRGEQAWLKQYDTDFWIFPNWKLDISSKKEILMQAGYRLFLHQPEPLPRKVKMKKRPGLWNWDVDLF